MFSRSRDCFLYETDSEQSGQSNMKWADGKFLRRVSVFVESPSARRYV